MNTTPLITIIVPIYNTARYLPRCLDSICNQTYQNLEIILVDDGSTDNSLQICQDYAAKDKRIRIFRQENKGVSAARNLGLENMTGDLFTFVDSDDFVIPQYTACLLSLMNHFQTSIATAELERVLPHAQAQQIYQEKLLSKEEAFFFVKMHIASKMYRTADFADLRFESRYALGEDSLFFLNALQRISSLAYTNRPIYKFCPRVASATGTLDVAARYLFFSLWKELEEKIPYAKTKQVMHDSALGAAATLSLCILLLGEDPKYPQAQSEAYDYIRQHAHTINRNKQMHLPGKCFSWMLVYCPRLTAFICHFPGIKQLLLKLAPSRFA